jgi:hypothetical protein
VKEIIVMAVEREVAVASGSKLSLDEKLALVSNLDPDLRRAIDAAREADQRRKKRREEKKAGSGTAAGKLISSSAQLAFLPCSKSGTS